MNIQIQTVKNCGGHRVDWRKVLYVVILILFALNILTIHTLNDLNDGRLNALGTTLTYTKICHLESVELIDAAVVSGVLDEGFLESWERDCIQLSRFLSILTYLDSDNAEEWSGIKFGVDEFVQFSSNLKNELAYYFAYVSKDYLLTEEQSHHLGMIRDALGEFKEAFPERVETGSTPSVEVPSEGLRRAAEASQQLCARIYAARLVFGLDGN
jgi:hypothetical protein